MDLANLANFSLIKTGFYTNVLVGIFAFLIDRFFEISTCTGPTIHIGGTFILCIAAAGYLFKFVVKRSKLKLWKSWKFYALIFPLFISSCLASLNVVDLWWKPNEWIFPNYVNSGDVTMENSWWDACAYLQGTVLHIIHYIVLYNFKNGCSWRSLTLYTSSTLTTMVTIWITILVSTSGPLSLISKSFCIYIPFMTLLPICIYMEPKSFTFRTNKNGVNFLSQGNALDLVTFVLMILTVLIVIGKFLASTGITFFLLGWIKDADPTIFLPTAPSSIPAGVSHACLNLVTVGPSFVLCLYYMFEGGKKPEFLWDLAIIQAGIISVGYIYPFIGGFDNDTPKEFQVDWTDPMFWIVNFVPLIASFLYLEHLSRDRLDQKKIN